MNVTFRFCFRSPLKSLKLPVFKGLSTDLGSHSFLHISFYPLYIQKPIIRCGMNDVSDGEQPYGKNQDSYNKFKDPGTCRTVNLDLRKDASWLFFITILE